MLSSGLTLNALTRPWCEDGSTESLAKRKKTIKHNFFALIINCDEHRRNARSSFVHVVYE